MRDLSIAALIFIIAPTLFLAIITLIVSLLRAAVTRTTFNWVRVVKALFGALVIEFLVLVLGGLVVGLQFGRYLGYGVPIVIALITTALGVASFIDYFFNGLPGWFKLHFWKK